MKSLKQLTWLLAASLVACATRDDSTMPPSPQEPQANDPSAQAIDSGLGSPEKAQLLRRAEGGDRDAAFRLSWHYNSIGDVEQARKWQQVAAKQGHPVAQYNQWFDLRNRRDCASMKLGLHLLQSAAQSGLKDAQDALGSYASAAESCTE